jgi:transposase InsO family protein
MGKGDLMDENKRMEVAAFRYQLIAGVVNRATPLSPGEIGAYFRKIASMVWNPDGNPTRVSIRTLERYKHLYEKGGLDALKPAGMPARGCRLSSEILFAAETLRKELPSRSVEQIIFLLEQQNPVWKDQIPPSTLARHFRNKDLTRRQLVKGNSEDRYRRFETDAPLRIWQSDFKHSVYLTDPLSQNRKRKTILCLILDDYSRYVMHAQYFWNEKLPCLEETLKKAIEKHGIPEQFYCDGGSAFSAKHLANICSRLGIRLSHSQPYRPAGRGKCERIFQFLDSSFHPEVYVAIHQGKIVDLEGLNKALQVWLDGYYHQRRHGTTQQTPAERMGSFPVKPLPYGKEELRRFFFVEETRKVDKTGCISLDGIAYEVPQELAKKKVQVRYDPFDPSDAEIYVEGAFSGKARLLDAVKNFHKPQPRRKKEVKEIPVSYSILDAAEKSRDMQWGELHYSREETS